MTAPLYHLFSADIKDGQLEGYRLYAKEQAEVVQRKCPRLLAFHLYLSEDGRRVTSVQVHPDAASMDFFLKEAHDVKAYEFLAQGTERSDAFGIFGDAFRQAIRQYGVTLSLNPEHLGGFTRFQAS